jgi:hypothetical protein
VRKASPAQWNRFALFLRRKTLKTFHAFFFTFIALYSHRLKKLFAGITDARERHKERHRPSGFEFALADSVHYLNSGHWDAVTASAGLFLRRSYLSILEKCCLDQFSLRYAMIYRRGEPQAAVVGQILELSGDQAISVGGAKQNLLKRALSPAARKVSAAVRARALVCGNLFSWGCHGVAFGPNTLANELWPGVAEALYRIRRSERLSGQTNLVFIKELSSDQQQSAEPLRRFSYRPIETDPDMVLELKPEWRKYEDYLNSLDRKYRKSAQQIVKEIEDAGCLVQRAREPDLYMERLHELYLSVHRNAAIRPATLPPDYLPALAKSAGEDFSCIILRRGEEILGFVTLLRDGELAIGYYIGYDREAAATLPLYLRLLHAVVEQAIDWKCRRLSLGRTALEPKARLGAAPQPLFIWARHRHPTVNFFVRKLTYAIPHGEPPQRNPFKKPCSD